MKMDNKGFTTVEMLISLAILSLALGSIYNLYVSFVRIYTQEGVKTKVQQNVRSGLDMMVRDIRMAGLDPQITDSFGMVDVSSKRIQFTGDRDMDGELDSPDASDGIDAPDMEQMAYEYNDGVDRLEMILYRSDGTIEMRDTLVENVTDLTFTYFDTDDVTTFDKDLIRTVEIQMTIRKPAGRSGMVSRTLIKRVQCRNLDFN